MKSKFGFWMIYVILMFSVFMAGCRNGELKNGEEPVPAKEQGYYRLEDCGVTDSVPVEYAIEETDEAKDFPGTVLGAMEESGKGLIYYGHDQGTAVLYEVQTKREINPELDGLSAYAYCACADGEGTMFFCDTNTLWSLSGKEKQLLCRFTDWDYYLERIDKVSVLADGVIEIYAFMEGEEHRIHCIKEVGERISPKEITVALSRNDRGIAMAAAEFNRSQENYRIVLELPKEKEDFSDFRTRIQLEMTSGGGPDIVDNTVLLNYRDYVRKGLLTSLSDIIVDASDFIPASLTQGFYNHENYGAPYQCCVKLVAYSKKELGERTSLTLDDLRKIMENSSAEVLDASLDAVDTVYRYVLGDKINKEFIDWENKVSHLNEPSFVEWLRFVKDHAGASGQNTPKNKALSLTCTIMSRSDLNYIKEYFAGDEIVLGYPDIDGGKNLITSYLLFLNANSENKEEAKEFIRYVISKENQTKRAEYQMPIGVREVANTPMLPVRMSALKAWLEAGDEDGERTVTYFRDGIMYMETELTEQQKAKFLSAVENAGYLEFGTSLLEDIFYEELSPYFDGEKSAEEAANILHNRIQLYLHENGDSF